MFFFLLRTLSPVIGKCFRIEHTQIHNVNAEIVDILFIYSVDRVKNHRRLVCFYFFPAFSTFCMSIQY